MYEVLAHEHPAEPVYRYYLANALSTLSTVLWHMGRHDEAFPLIERALQVSQRVADQSPEVPDYRHRLADIYGSLAQLFWEAGRFADAIQARRKALEQHVMLESKHPDRDYEKHVAQSQRFLAMMLSCCPDPRFRDPAEAVRLAEAAASILPQGGNSWCVVGEARYRAGNWKGAIEALEKSQTLDDDRMAPRALLLQAMANWKRGRRDHALLCYQKAFAEITRPHAQENQPRRFRHGVDRKLDLLARPETDPDVLGGLQAETEDLLGMTEHPTPTGRKEENPKQRLKP
jgi:tetratricopeptide (TPR) repeat protein